MLNQIIKKIKKHGIKKILKRIILYFDFFLNHNFGEFSVKRRLKNMSLTQSNLSIERLNIKFKKILLIIAHPDDEIIWGNTILTNNEANLIETIIVYDGGEKRNTIVKNNINKTNNILTHLKIKRDQKSKRNNNAEISKIDTKKISKIIEEKINSNKYDIIFTHNEFGEYGHGHHSQLHKIVKKIHKSIKTNSRLIFFGFAYPLMYNNGKTYWIKTLKVFATNKTWQKKSKTTVLPFSGIFKFKKYNKYFYHETNCYLPQKNVKLALELAHNYSKATDSWIAWLKPSTHYYKYLLNNIQFFYDPKLPKHNHIEYEWPSIEIKARHPMKGSLLNPAYLSDHRTFLNDYLIDYLHFEKNVLWIGWDKFCVANNYLKKLGKYTNHIELLDNKKTRKDKKIYGEQTVDYVGDICNLNGIIDSKKYDCIYINGVLEYVDSITRAISEVARITKKHGRILIGVPGKDYNSTGWNRPSFNDIIKILKKNNLIAIEVWRKYNPDYYYIHIYKQ